ncbi:hypothetical protein ACTFIW_010194 [Dictyostelium discoideum]
MNQNFGFKLFFLFFFFYFFFGINCSQQQQELQNKNYNNILNYLNETFNNNNNDNINSNLNNNYNNNNNNNNIKLWVFFNSKEIIKVNNNNHNDIKLKIGINNESIKRRSKLLKNQIIDDTDLPVSENYVNQILKCNNKIIKLGYKSNWLNSISISLLFDDKVSSASSSFSSSSSPPPPPPSLSRIEIIENITKCIVLKPFVEKIDIVSKLKKVKESETVTPTPPLESTSVNETFYGKSADGIKQISMDKLIEMGLDGSGVVILIIDDGFYKDHQCFKKLRILGELNLDQQSPHMNDTQDRPMMEEDHDHGTATLSVLSCDMPGVMIGGARNASYLLARITIFDEIDSYIEEDQWVVALEWGEKMGADLVSSSLSYLLSFNYSFAGLDGKTSHTTIATNLASSKGVLIVNSMGNNDFSIYGAPNDGENVISVGAVDRRGNMAYFSSIGPTADGRIKPDTLALGIDIYVASISGPSNFTRMSGTSFSCPLVASAIALLMQARPNWTSTQLHEAVIDSCEWSIYPHYYMGWGIFNVSKALSYKPIPMNNTCFNNCNSSGLCCKISNNNLASSSSSSISQQNYFNSCNCANAYYGRYCQYKRIECGYRCKYDFLGETKCQKNNFNDKISFRCIKSSQYNNSIVNFDPYKIPTTCKIIGDTRPNQNKFINDDNDNDDNNNSSNNNNNNNFNLFNNYFFKLFILILILI